MNEGVAAPRSSFSKRLRVALAGLATLAVIATTAVTPATPAQAAFPWLCHSNVAIRSVANGRFVSADLDRNSNERGMLRASWATTVGPWERFTLCFESTWWSGRTTIYSHANGQFVAAEIGYGGPSHAMLRARSGSVGPWEIFNLSGGSLQSEGNGLFVSAELAYADRNHGMLRARHGAVGPWEQFEFLTV